MSTEASSTETKAADPHEAASNGQPAKAATKPKPKAPAAKAVAKKPEQKPKAAPAKSKTSATKTAAPKPTAKKAAPKARKAAEKPMEPQRAVSQAEDVLDETGKKIGAFMAALSHRLKRAAAFAKEEAEDLWAEAQSIRRGDLE